MKLSISLVSAVALVLTFAASLTALEVNSCPPNHCPEVLDGYTYVGTCVTTTGNPCLGWVYKKGSEKCHVAALGGAVTAETAEAPESEAVSADMRVDQKATEPIFASGAPECTKFATQSSAECTYLACEERGCGAPMWPISEWECRCGYAF